MHNYGICHRDMKLENIMMTDDTEDSEPRIVDFGLAKFLGPSETVNDLFGTLGYAAPEILKKEQYSFSVDMWALGIITYALVSGCLPFDHENKKELVRMTCEEPVDFNMSAFTKAGKEVKNLISNLLNKDPSKRIKIEDSIMHEWIVGADSSPQARKRKNFVHEADNKFSLLALTENK